MPAASVFPDGPHVRVLRNRGGQPLPLPCGRRLWKYLACVSAAQSGWCWSTASFHISCCGRILWIYGTLTTETLTTTSQVSASFPAEKSAEETPCSWLWRGDLGCDRLPCTSLGRTSQNSSLSRGPCCGSAPRASVSHWGRDLLSSVTFQCTDGGPATQTLRDCLLTWGTGRGGFGVREGPLRLKTFLLYVPEVKLVRERGFV